ncbi:MAG: cyclopropane-fatty-acyl-phospholipid synthase family protein [Phycisphaerales bacterium]
MSRPTTTPNAAARTQVVAEAERPLSTGIRLAERGWVPDALLRRGIRSLCRDRLREEREGGSEAIAAREAAFLAAMAGDQVAPVPEKANDQHYEVPADFYATCLGPHRKYSSCWWPEGTTTLAEAEAAALAETCRRAGLDEPEPNGPGSGMDILELGCGWGSLTLWMGEHYPNARIRAVSNSASQRAHIMGEAERRGLGNIQVVTRDMNDFDAHRDVPGFAGADRIVSVEMFEHMRNWPELMRRAATWVRPDGSLFLHVFCHRTLVYPFQADGNDDWMGRYFFSGGIMPSADLATRFDRDFRVDEQWIWDGTHYGRTAEAWLEHLDRHRDQAMPILKRTYGADAKLWFQRWRMFFLACAELFNYDGGQEWMVVHWRLRPQSAPRPVADPPIVEVGGRVATPSETGS